MNKDLIPTDNSIDSVKMREQIIRDFYREWKEQNPLQRKYNVALKEYINGKGIPADAFIIAPQCVKEVYASA